MPTMTSCLWFDTQAEQAAEHYTRIFPSSKVTQTVRYGPAGPGPEGTVMTVSFELDGRPFVALNGGPAFTFTEAVSFQVICQTQGEVDHYWTALCEGGEQGPCGWLKDKFGLSWQVVPQLLLDYVGGPDAQQAQRVMTVMLGMKKLDIEPLRHAAQEV